MNMVPIVIEPDDETSKVLCGMNYHKYSLDDDDCVTGLSCEEIQKALRITVYCFHTRTKGIKNLSVSMELYSMIGRLLTAWGIKTYQYCVQKNLQWM